MCYACARTREIAQRELRNDNTEIMRRLEEGESFVVTRNGTTVGDLSPLRRRRFVRSGTAVALFRQAPSVDRARFREDLDRLSSQETGPRA